MEYVEFEIVTKGNQIFKWTQGSLERAVARLGGSSMLVSWKL